MKVNGKIKLSICLIMCLSSQVYADNSATTTLKEVEVMGVEDNTESYTVSGLRTATKLDLSARETPQSVLVFTKQKLEDQNITTYQELLAKTPGVTLNQMDERVYPTARGFTIDYYLFDGIPTYSVSDNADDPDLSIFDRVEIVKGANGLMTGAGNPAMGMNFIRKHANSKELKGNIDFSAGSWNNYSSTADIQTSLNEEGTVRVRVVAKHQDQDSFMDKYEKSTDVLYGVLDMDLTNTTFLSLGASVEDIDRSGIRWGGLPAFYGDGSKTHFDNSNTISDDWAEWNIKTTNYYADLKQYIINDSFINLSLSRKEISSDGNLVYYGGRVDKNTGGQVLGSSDYGVYGYEFAKDIKENNIDLYTSIPFEVGKLGQEIIIGAMYNKSKTKKNDYASNLNWSTIDFNNISIPKPTYGASTHDNLDETTQSGIYFAGKFSLSEELKLISGIRLSSWKYENDDSTRNREFKNETTPYVGLVYDINKNHSIYTSYTSIFKPQDKKDNSGNYLDPIDGKNYEVGIKGEYFEGDLNTSLTLFRIEQDGAPSDTGEVNSKLESIYEAKEVVSKGFEISVSGKVTDNLDLDFGLANFQAKNSDGSKYNTTSSRTTANLFAKYSIKDYRIGAGINYKSKIYTDTDYGRITQDSYVTVDLMTGYKVNNNLDFQLNVNNLFDKEYYSGLGYSGMVYGSPRSATISMKYRF